MEKRASRHTAAVVILCILLAVAFLAFFSAVWYVSVFGRTGFDSVLYTLTGGLSGVSAGLVGRYLFFAALPAALWAALVGLLLFQTWARLSIPFFGGRRLKLLPFKRSTACVLAAVISLGLLTHAAFNVKLVDYVASCFRDSQLYEDEYRAPGSTSITFPKQKRNLIYIMLESMETSFLSTQDGGAMPVDLIPELTQLARDNVNFSHNSSVGGFREVPGTTWTVGAMVGHTAGVPLRTPDGLADSFNGYGQSGSFLPGLTTLNDILRANGYYQELMVGSDINFGGRGTYYRTHGVDRICDLYTARQDGIVPPGYFVWWGMEDVHLFEYAKQELTRISQQEQPFAFSMLTVDTHHVGGYKCALCQNEYAEQYKNVISCSSRQVAAFVAWIQAQPFYENTTVIITGDHCSMDNGFFSRNVEAGYVRHVYNCFINAAAEPVNTAGRQFCTLDMFPTTLAALGCAIHGDRLGLGTNLFSGRPTLMEAMGYDALTLELASGKKFYAEHFFAPGEELSHD